MNAQMKVLALRQRQQAKTLADVKTYYQDVLGLKIGQNRKTFAWADTRPEATYRRCIQFFRDSKAVMEQSNGEIFIFVWLGPRDSGKSTIMQAESAHAIHMDHEETIAYASETQLQSSKRVLKVQSSLMRKPAVRLFGNLRTTWWGKDEFWVQRESGFGENPTVYATGPGKASTGYHSGIYALDDVVGRQTNYTPFSRAVVIDWFGEVLDQAEGTSVIWIIGTMWKGFQLYRHIMENKDLRKHAHVVVVPAIGAAHNGAGMELFGGDNYQHYPWLTPRYLEIKREALQDDDKWRAQYFNEIVGDTALNFQIDMLHAGNPPMVGGQVDRSQVEVYIVTDTATTTRKSRKASRSVIAVVAKDYMNTCWVLDFVFGMMAPDMFAKDFFRLWLKWKPRWYVMENTGPGAERRWLLNEVAARRNIGIPPIRDVGRWGTDKDSRIQMLFPAMNGNRFYFADSVPKEHFRINPNTGLPNGSIPQACLRYDPDSMRAGKDILDCLADSVLTDRNGSYFCPPAPPPRSRKEVPKETPIQRAIRELMSSGAGTDLVDFL